VKVVKKQGKSLDPSKAHSAKGTRTFCLHHPPEGEEEDQEGADQEEEEEPTPQMMTTTMIEDIVASTEKHTWHELQIEGTRNFLGTLSDGTNPG